MEKVFSAPMYRVKIKIKNTETGTWKSLAVISDDGKEIRVQNMDGPDGFLKEETLYEINGREDPFFARHKYGSEWVLY